jgi:hypothetical protein
MIGVDIEQRRSMTQREVATMERAGYHGYPRSKCILLGRSGIREIAQGARTNLATTGRNDR